VCISYFSLWREQLIFICSVIPLLSHTLFAIAGAFIISWDKFPILILKQSVCCVTSCCVTTVASSPSSSIWPLTFQFIAGTRQRIYVIVTNSQCAFFNYKIICHVNLLSGLHFIQSSWLHCIGGYSMQIKQITVMHNYIAQSLSVAAAQMQGLSSISLPGLTCSTVFVWHVYVGLTWRIKIHIYKSSMCVCACTCTRSSL